jgi:NitT/TauT family transport system ATP-binding protein
MFIRIKQLEKSYLTQEGRLAVLNNVSFDTAANTITAILGPSGCGKSTLLRLIAALETPDSGEVVVNSTSQKKVITEIVFQQHSLLPWRTALENVLLPFELRNRTLPIVSNDEWQIRALSLLKRMGLSSFAHYYPHELSTGMKSRVALARALITSPQILLLDEAFSTLDEITRNALQEILIEVVRELQLTVFFVTHSIDESVAVADRVLVFSNRPATVVGDVTISLSGGPLQRSDSSEIIEIRAELRRILRGNRSSI